MFYGMFYFTCDRSFTDAAEPSERRLKVESQTAAARSAVATAAVHVARAEERSAVLERVAADTAEQMMTAAEIASETDKLVNEQRRTEDEAMREAEAREMERRKQDEKAIAAAAAAVNRWKQLQQRQKQSEKEEKVKRSREGESSKSKKRNSRTTENSKTQSQTQVQEDVSSWPYFM